MVLAAEGGVTDETLLVAAVLHDTIEDGLALILLRRASK